MPHKTPAWFFEHRYDHWDDGSQLDLARPLAFTPGTKQRYGNADYWMAGLLIQRITERTREREVIDRIIRPLALRGTSAPADDPHPPARTLGCRLPEAQQPYPGQPQQPPRAGHVPWG